MKPLQRSPVIVLHLLFWVLVFATWYFLRYEDYALRSTALKVTAAKVIDLALMVYITNYLLLPRLLYNRHYLWFAVLFIFLIVTSSVIKMQVLGWIMGLPGSVLTNGSLKQRIYDNLIPHFFLVSAGAGFKLMWDYRKLQQRLAETAREKAEAELNFLKSQINPHFLFNSLNTVYFLIDKQNNDARKALHQFSDMLRYQLYEMNGEWIPVEKELQYLRGYFELQRLRKETGYELEFREGDGLHGFSIAPLLLIPFIENAFKHLSHFTQQLNYIHVSLERKDDSLHFHVVNSTQPQTSQENGGIGLQNVARRLELLYPGKHELSIIHELEKFEVSLRIRIEKV